MSMNSGIGENGRTTTRGANAKPSGNEDDDRSLAGKVAEKIDPQAIVDGAKRLPEIIRREVQENPYRALGVAVGVGFGVGALFSSRIARVLLVTAGGYALNEVARTRIKHFLDEIDVEGAK